MDFLNKLEALMKQNNIRNLHDLSIQSGIPYTTLRGFYSQGTDNIKLSTLTKLKNCFGCTLDYLVCDNLIEPTAINVKHTNSSLDTRTEMLKNLILVKYKSYREFAKIINMPQSTLMSALNNGIGGTSIDNVIKMCHALGITADDLAYERFDNILTPELQELINNAKHLTSEQLNKLNDFINTLK